MLTDLVSLVRYSLGQEDELAPYADEVEERFQAWLAAQQQAGAAFTDEQMKWLTMIKEHIATSMVVSADDFEMMPFAEHGGLGKAHEVFGDELERVLDRLNEELVA